LLKESLGDHKNSANQNFDKAGAPVKSNFGRPQHRYVSEPQSILKSARPDHVLFGQGAALRANPESLPKFSLPPTGNKNFRRKVFIYKSNNNNNDDNCSREDSDERRTSTRAVRGSQPFKIYEDHQDPGGKGGSLVHAGRGSQPFKTPQGYGNPP